MNTAPGVEFHDGFSSVGGSDAEGLGLGSPLMPSQA